MKLCAEQYRLFGRQYHNLIHFSTSKFLTFLGMHISIIAALFYHLLEEGSKVNQVSKYQQDKYTLDP